MHARSAVQCRSARLSEAVSPAKSARVAIGLIVVKSVAKSLLILIKRGDICRRVCFILIRTADQARGKVGAGTARSSASNVFPIQRVLSRDSLGDGGHVPTNHAAKPRSVTSFPPSSTYPFRSHHGLRVKRRAASTLTQSPAAGAAP